MLNSYFRRGLCRLFYSYSTLRTKSPNVLKACGFSEKSYLKKTNLLYAANSVKYHQPITNMSGEKGIIKTVTFEDIKTFEDDKQVLLVDVREPSELQETGILPASINIPLAELENVLKNVSSSDFMKRYGRTKPDFKFPLVFSCRSGRRSESAAQIAAKLGYTNISNYSGGWLDWEKNTKS